MIKKNSYRIEYFSQQLVQTCSNCQKNPQFSIIMKQLSNNVLILVCIQEKELLEEFMGPSLFNFINLSIPSWEESARLRFRILKLRCAL